MSPLDQAPIINAVVPFAVLEADLGRHRTIGWWRPVRPLPPAGAITRSVAMAVRAACSTRTPRTRRASVSVTVAGAPANLGEVSR